LLDLDRAVGLLMKLSASAVICIAADVKVVLAEKSTDIGTAFLECDPRILQTN
jgi:hypothetical protein